MIYTTYKTIYPHFFNESTNKLIFNKCQFLVYVTYKSLVLFIILMRCSSM